MAVRPYTCQPWLAQKSGAAQTEAAADEQAQARQALLTCHCCHERKSTPGALRARFGPGFYKRPGQFTTTPPVLTRGELLFGGARRKCRNTCPLFNEKLEAHAWSRRGAGPKKKLWIFARRTLLCFEKPKYRKTRTLLCFALGFGSDFGFGQSRPYIRQRYYY